MAGVDYLPGSLRDQARLLRVAGKSYPHEYLQGLQDGQNGGYELFQSAAKVGERVSLAVARMEAGRFKLYARGGAKSTGTVEFYRLSTGGPAYTIMAGTVVETGTLVLPAFDATNPVVLPDGRRFISTGVRFLTTADVTFAANALGPHSCPVQAEAVGYEYDTTGPVTRPSGEILEGDIALIRTLITSSPVFDSLIMVRQTSDTTGGRPAWLDGLGEQFGIPRIAGEADDQYRLRIEQVGDAVSPDAIQRAVDKILGQYGYTCAIYEIGIPPFTGIFDDAGSSADSPQYPEWNFADDMDFTAQPLDRFKLDMSHLESRAFFLVAVPTGLSGDALGAIWQEIVDKHAGGVGFDLVFG